MGEEKMSKAVENLQEAQKFAVSVRPKVGGFPYLAEVLRLAGVTRNRWYLPSGQSLYLTKYGSVVSQGTPLLTGITDVPKFDREALIRALRIDQAGESTFPEFLRAAWEVGVVSYDIDFEDHKVTYYGSLDETFVEDYPSVAVNR
jgi:uncharacterized protein YbcV (DUF1398 family)